ncbi:MAG: hormogonium polysaccharide secretion pseudopilin HpsB [Pelatocladus maniniholoensis HA4357-MV3]|uniref:Hormogonium polysaccharide secretion pseudopilin HpsB n=1 Tax=Pelatocladus maniniholoensis HA4357-MV3 TaxID=1117104 RepID=A0A9E3LQY0_9NOST|nr:hormogonium polysaccharide secretion pseudopilin HpsB [Pelatocladus maniniholoensis HA4357-MV3]
MAISKITQSNQRGFTIIESLIALLVVSILLAAIAPVITLAVATRVQSRQVELASQAARTYIDGVRTGKIDAPTSTGSDTLNAYTAPTTTGTLTCPTSTNPNAYCTAPTGTSLYCVNFDSTDGCQNSSLTDMVIQAFRYNPTSGSTAANGYSLGIRVYRADAFKLSTTLSRNNAGGNNEKVTQNSFTGGAGQRTSPLVEMITDINETVPKYNDLCDRLGGCNN